VFKFPFIPREQKFFDLFEESARNMVGAAQVLKELVDTWELVEGKVGEIARMEDEGDAVTHQIMAQLNRTFVTPFDREDIVLLAHSLDDVVDFIDAAADAMLIYKVDKPTPRSKGLENVADEVFRSSMAELFDDTPDMAQVIKWREIYEHMESATDRCEDVSNVLEGVALKYA